MAAGSPGKREPVSAEVATGLAEVLEPAIGPVSIRDLRRLTAGANRETWSFDAVDGAGRCHELILQRDREGLERLIGTCAREAEILRCAAAHGVPVAEVVVSSGVPNPLTRSFTINRRLRGETIGRRILRDPEWAGARRSFVTDCARSLARIHHIERHHLDHLELPEIPDALAAWSATYETLADRHPAFDLAFRWLETNRPSPLPTSVVHGDFRLGNLLFDNDGLAAVLDWEITHFGDPAQDLGWLCVRAWQFGGPHPVGGIGTYDELLAGYASESGHTVPMATLRWWELFGTLRWGVICLQMGGDFRSGRTGSVEMATIGRRVVENAYDVLRLLP